MYLEVYVDVIFTINLVMDIVLLKLLEKLGRLKTTSFRIILGGAIGGLSGCAMSLLPMIDGVIRFILLYIVTGYLMIIVAFPKRTFKNYIKNLFILFMLTYSLGGLLNSLYYHTNMGYYMYLLSSGSIFSFSTKKLLLLAPIAIGSMIGLVYLIKKVRHQLLIYYKVELRYDDKSICLKGLLDTGNGLKDPFSHKPVSIVCYEDVKCILPETLIQLIEKYYENGDILMTSASMQQYQLLRWIPFRSIGKEQGMLLGVVFPEMTINPYTESIKDRLQKANIKYDKAIIGLYQGRLSNQKDYQMILHKDLL